MELDRIRIADLSEVLQDAIEAYEILSDSGDELLKDAIPIIIKRIPSKNFIFALSEYRCNRPNDGWELAFIQREFYEAYLKNQTAKGYKVRLVVCCCRKPQINPGAPSGGSGE